MNLDRERAESKKAELASVVDEALSSLLDQKVEIGGEVINHCAKISPPEKEETKFHVIRISKHGRRGGKSVKPGNIRLNIGRLMSVVATGVLSVAGAAASPWTIPFAVVVLWDKIWKSASEDIKERDAAVLWTMWKHRDSANRVSKAGLLDKVNKELEDCGRGSISEEELSDSVRTLREIRCIAPARHNVDKWWLREWIGVTYR